MMTHYARAGDANLLVETDLQFHLAIYGMSKHQMLIDTLERLSGQTPPFIRLPKQCMPFFQPWKMRQIRTWLSLKQLEKRDSSWARSVIRKHICEVGERFLIFAEKSGSRRV